MQILEEFEQHIRDAFADAPSKKAKPAESSSSESDMLGIASRTEEDDES